jgi:hypothetical protein
MPAESEQRIAARGPAAAAIFCLRIVILGLN